MYVTQHRYKYLSLAVLTGAIALGGAACQKDDSAAAEERKQILEKLTALEKKIDSAGQRPGAARPQRPRPPGPDATTVYSVPVDGSPWRGAEHAKVTIVEGFEFA